MERPTDQPIAWLNGQFLKFAEAKLPVYDLSIVQGATLTERWRTFGHRQFQVDAHLTRLQLGLLYTGWEPTPSLHELPDLLRQVVEHNCRLIAHDDDLSVVLFISAGPFLPDAAGLETESRPSIGIYTAALAHQRHRHWYEQGVNLVVPDIRQLPATVLDPGVKHRSRLHWHLADRQARSRENGAQALLLDERGFVTETSSGNLFVRQGDRLLTPSSRTTLSGTAQAFVIELSRGLGIETQQADLTPRDVQLAAEAFLTSSTYGVAPVRSLNGEPIGGRLPGGTTRELQQAWSTAVGVDFVMQAQRFSE